MSIHKMNRGQAKIWKLMQHGKAKAKAKEKIGKEKEKEKEQE